MTPVKLTEECCCTVNAICRETVASRARTNGASFAEMMLGNVTALITGLTAFLLFAGNSYYETLLNGFGLSNGLVKIDEIDIATMGFWSLCLAVSTLVKQLIVPVVKAVAFATLIGFIFAAIVWRFPQVRRKLHGIEPTFNKLQSLNNRSLTWFMALLFALHGITAGSAGGQYDLKAIRSGRAKTTICYYIDNRPYRARLLIQDETRSIFVHPDRTSIVNNERLSVVADCPAQNRVAIKSQS